MNPYKEVITDPITLQPTLVNVSINEFTVVLTLEDGCGVEIEVYDGVTTARIFSEDDYIVGTTIKLK